MQKKKLNDWHVWGEWPGIPWFHGCYNTGLAIDLKARSGVGLTKYAVDYRDHTMRIYFLKHEWTEGGQWYLQEVLKNPKKLAHDLRAIEQASDQLHALNRKLFRLRVEQLTPKELGRWYDRFHTAQHEVWVSGMVPNLLELNQSYLSSYCRAYIQKVYGKFSPEQWQTLITPTILSAVQEEERAFLSLVIAIENNRRARATILRAGDDLPRIDAALRTFPALHKRLEHHWHTYRWIQYGWTGPAFTREYYLDLLSRFFREGKAKRLRAKIVRDDQLLATKQRRLERTVSLDPHHQELLVLLRRLLSSKVRRMDALYEGYCAIEPVLKALAKHLSLSMNQLYMIYGDDMKAILKRGKADTDALNEAMRYSAFVKEGNRLRFYIGSDARRKMKSILAVLPKVKKVRSVTGEIAYPGKVRGVVVCIDSAKDMSKMREGDILVSHATDPSVLPAMKKAAAFVTDLGGLTAHAAIVAREMKKPCIVGTKIATQIFKDGDRVEVDAEKGIVRKL